MKKIREKVKAIRAVVRDNCQGQIVGVVSESAVEIFQELEDIRKELLAIRESVSDCCPGTLAGIVAESVREIIGE